MLDTKTPDLLTNYREGEITLENAKSSYILDNNALDKNEEKTYNLRVWLDENVTLETEGVQNSTWSAKVTITAKYSDHLPTDYELCVAKYGEDSINCSIIAQLDNTGKCPTVNEDGTVKFSSSESTNGYLCSAPDDYGTSYYYRGNVENNWVKFAGYYWRIIRINGDGTVRMIYQGTEANTTGTGTQIETSVFNTENNASYYVGLVYNLNEQHGYGINSTIMDNLNSWFNDNLNNDSNPSKQFYEYISNEAGFCSDRNMSSGYNWSSNPTSNIYYAANDRITNNLATPSLQCDEQDILSKSNGKLENPIGLITIDEAVLAGLYFTAKNTVNNFLNTERLYWTMTPYLYAVTRYESKAYVYLIYSAGYVGDFSSGFVTNVNGVRPVINLRADVQIVSGDGTASNPYVIAT